jgi:hypothetical protein
MRYNTDSSLQRILNDAFLANYNTSKLMKVIRSFLWKWLGVVQLVQPVKNDESVELKHCLFIAV